MKGIGSMAGRNDPEQARQPVQPEGGDQEAESNVSPEEQAQYDQFMTNAMRIIYPDGEGDPQVSQNITTGLQSMPDKPLMALATTAVTVVVGLRDSAEKAGSPISDEILFHAGADVVAELAEVAEAAGIHEFSEEDVENAFYIALELYRGEAEKSGHIDREAAQQGLNQIMEAERSGGLEQALPGIGDRLKGAR